MQVMWPVSTALKLAVVSLLVGVFVGVIVGVLLSMAVLAPESQPSQPSRAPMTRVADPPPGQPE